MATPPTAFTANSNTTDDIAALQAIANTRFISMSTPAINSAINMGLQYVVLTTFLNCNLTNLLTYYHSLGYQVVLPDVHYQNSYDNAPYSFYGVDYYDWLTNNYIFGQIENPTRLRIMWNLPFNGGSVIPVPSTQVIAYTISQNNEFVSADTTDGSFTVSLPASPLNGWIESVTAISAANVLTISGNGNTINGSSSPIVNSVVGTTYSFLFSAGYGWTTL